MQQGINGNNRGIKYAVTGLLLIIAAFGYAIANQAQESEISMSAVITCALGVAAIAMLTKAIKQQEEPDELGQL